MTNTGEMSGGKVGQNDGENKRGPKNEMHVVGDPKAVFAMLHEYAELVKKGERPERGPLIIFGGGATQALASNMGAALALEKMGLPRGQCAANIFGISIGAVVASMYALGVTEKFLDRCTANPLSPIVDAKISGSDKQQNINLYKIHGILEYDDNVGVTKEKLAGLSPTLLTAVTNKETGEQEIINLKNDADPLDTLVSASTLSGVADIRQNPDTKNVKEPKYIDGTLSNILPLQKLIETLNPTCVLIFNGASEAGNESENKSMLKRIIAGLRKDNLRVVIEKMRNIAAGKERDEKFLADYMQAGGKVVRFYPSDEVGPIDGDQQKVWENIFRVRDFVITSIT